MTTKSMKYVHESLGTCGFAILAYEVAMRLRPDIWVTAVECSSDLANVALASKVRGLTSVTRFTAQLEGVSRNVLVLTRSPDFLARRIQWVTGFNVVQLLPEGGQHLPAPSPQPEPTMQRWSDPKTDDRYHGIVTKESARTCGQCQNLSAGHNCRVPEVSGLKRPSGGTWRRCLGYVPTYEQLDGRTGVQLWPELV